MRRLSLFVLLGLGGCQCFQPVAEELDAGVIDAGQRECFVASDCAPVSAPRQCGFGAGEPTRSCFDGRCVYDCVGAARTCSTEVGSCMTCDGGLPNCPAAACGMVDDGITGRLSSDCFVGEEGRLGNFLVRYRTGATCNFQVFYADGGVFGSLDLLGEYTTGSAQVSAEPGVTCSVRALATALNRVELGCGRCLYMLEWP